MVPRRGFHEILSFLVAGKIAARSLAPRVQCDEAVKGPPRDFDPIGDDPTHSGVNSRAELDQ